MVVLLYYVLSDADLKMLEISRERGSDFVNLLYWCRRI